MSSTVTHLFITTLFFATLAFGNSCAFANSPETVRVVVSDHVAMPVEHALAELTKAFESKGLPVQRNPGSDLHVGLNLIVGIPGESSHVDSILTNLQLSVPERSESLLISKCKDLPGKQILVAGRDSRGLAYALLDIAAAIRTMQSSMSIYEVIDEARESPYLPVRSVTQQLFNQELERRWYESEEYWHWYFGMLAQNRFNNFTMTFGHNTNYMIPPYAWMITVPEYPDVQVAGMTQEDRDKSLRHFRRITEIAQEHGVDFTLGLWTQLPVVKVHEGFDFGESSVQHLPDGAARAEYCGRGLQMLLQSCPAISGIQLRMNLESGIPHNQQEEFYKTVFKGIADCGRPVKLDLRYKSLSQQTINLAKAAGLDVTVSTKHWCEHMGLPYHPTWQDSAYSESRYGFGNMLHHNRNYRVIYRLWNVGTSRVLLWGDPGYAARFAESCTLGNGEGFEVFAPLSYRGYGNEPDKWRLLKDDSLEHFRWEQERYWAFYLTFGRYGYNPSTSRKIWSREFLKRFERSGPAIETAMQSASQILPLLTATTQFSANSWRFWPEMLPCMHLDAYRAIQPSDYSQFYAIAPFASRRQWRSEDWASKHSGFVEDAINGNLNAKWTPIQVCAELESLADNIDCVCRGVETNLDYESRELNSTLVDLKALALLARYHAEKKQAATHLEFYHGTKDPIRLKFTWKHIQNAQRTWQQLVRITEEHYSDKLAFGHSQKHNSDYASKLHLHVGHWKDRLPEVQRDVDFVADLMDQQVIANRELTDSDVDSMKRYPGESVVKQKISVQHDRIKSAAPGRDIIINVNVTEGTAVKRVSVYYRPLRQTVAWKRLSLVPKDQRGEYTGTIKASELDPQYDFQYYIEVLHSQGGQLWPNWQNETPYVVVPILYP